VTRTAEFDITGMTCASCAARVERTLTQLPGVTASVNIATERATVDLPDAMSDAQVMAAISAMGYGARRHTADSALAEPGEPTELSLRLWVSVALTIPTVALAMVMPLQFPGWQWVSLVLATPVVTWGAWPFHRAALAAARHRSSTMDTLVCLGVSAAYLWSVAALIWGGAGSIGMTMPLHLGGDASGPAVYFEVATAVTTFLLLGRAWEARAKARGGQALRDLAQIGARQATLLRTDGEQQVPVAALLVGDRVRVRPGEKVPADGTVADGEAEVDVSFLTGESAPVRVRVGDSVVGASIVGGGTIDINLTAVGEATQVAQMNRLLEQAQAEKAPVQRLADRISAVFVPIVLALTLLTLLGWLLAGAGLQSALTAAVAVLIIACPCALGLATPTALLVGTGRGAQLGILIRGPQVLEATRAVTVIMLDKTGTVTDGRMAVAAVHVPDGGDGAMSGDRGAESAVQVGMPGRQTVITWAASLEARSEHPIGRAIAALTESRAPVADFTAEPGGGVRGTVDGHRLHIGSPQWLDRQGITVEPRLLPDSAAGLVVLAVDGAPAGVFEVRDRPRPHSAQAVAALRSLGLTPILLTGDRREAAESIAAEVGIDEVIAEASPADKLAAVAAVQGEGRAVAMVGDGINDALALVQADLGIAMAAGTDLAREASAITIMNSSLLSVVDAIRLSRRTLAIIRGNLVWAFAYNLAALPLAVAGLLNPMIAGAAMVLSSVFVVSNSLRLRRFAPLIADERS